MIPLPAVEPLLKTLGDELAARIAATATPVTLVGIHSGGVWLADRLAARLRLPAWQLSASYYRDDFAQSGLHPEVRPSHLPDNLEGHTVWLIDDVLHRGRTVRAALNEIFDFGRPAAVKLAVLVERNGRELPISADLSATRIDVPENCYIKLNGPDPLELELVRP